MNSQVLKIVAIFVIGFLLGAAALSFMKAHKKGKYEEDRDDRYQKEKNAAEGGDEMKEKEDGAAEDGSSVLGTSPQGEFTEDALIEIADQTAGESVVAARVHLPDSGWVVIHEIEGGHIANALGAARRNPGKYVDVEVELLRPTTPGGEYVAILYKDNGNEKFEITADLPVVDSFGEAMVAHFSTTE